MRLRYVQIAVLTFLLFLLSAVTQCRKKDIGPYIGSPIIVGDGSAHIRSEAPAHFTDANWDKSKKNEYHRIGSGKHQRFGKVYLAGCNGCTNWSGATKLGSPIYDFENDPGNKSKVVLTFGTDGTLTVEDENGKKGIVVKSHPKDLTGTCQSTDSDQELVCPSSSPITQIDFFTTNSSTATKTVDDKYIHTNCRDLGYSWCGVFINFN